MAIVRKIIFYGDYFRDFYLEQSPSVQEKIDYIFKLVQEVERVPTKFLDHIADTDGLYEIRVRVGNDIFRIFCCFDEGMLVVLFNAFQKKTQKTPKGELKLANKLKKEYFSSKGE